MEILKQSLGDLFSFIKCPVISEKSVDIYGNRQCTFLVDKSLTKPEIKYVLENIFNVKIMEVRTMNLPIKTKRVGKFKGKKTTYKKTYVKLKEGYVINNLFD
jgi:large subunit ribosomal protein L23